MNWRGPWKLKRWLLAMVILNILVVSLLSSPSSACSFPAVYNFGDSNSDTGSSSAAFGRVPSPNGETFFGRPSGRYSDGRLIIDFMADKLGLPYLNSYLDALQPNFRHGANFAVAGSTIQPGNGELFDAGFNPLSLDIQLLQFEQLKERTNEFYNQAKSSQIKSTFPRMEDFSKALYTLDSGQNDLHFWLTTIGEEQAKASIPSIINQFAMAIEKLYQEGARTFWIHNTGPIGCLPFFSVEYPPQAGNADQNGCIKSYNEVAQEFNKQLKDTVSLLRTQFDDAVLIYVDIYSAKYTLISEAKKLGFVSPLEYCWIHTEDSHAYCLNKVIVNGTEVNGVSCEDPSKYISWDNIHYTEAANRWIANRIMDGSLSDPPIPLTEACQKLLFSSL
ncbi:hypothetical protein JRO89_XS05G0094400 [Xanthoceras sorbifolium]|uniref:GDSL esterase/lipase At5g14450-like n=1 Tax=Xanthoceras sorbifolium TaxID=99658 RepID=A0ABQ8I171_9ROSI|nr:hypothetical protein JRO89_XS05G0094400 [Xanthoceras sorbifolium]